MRRAGSTDGVPRYDVVVIGGGIVGSMIARELSRFQGSFALFEKEPFAGSGVSKANPCMLHSPLMFPSGPLRIRLAYRAAERYRRLAAELDVPFREVGEMFVAFKPGQLEKLAAAQQWAEAHRVSGGHRLIGPAEIRRLEPHLSRRVIGALYAPGVGGIYAPEWTFALVENARQNGLEVFLRSRVEQILAGGPEDYVLRTSRGAFRARFVVNAAGLFADEIGRMVGDEDIGLRLTKGTMAILDKSVSHLVGNMVYGSFGPDHSQMITPTVHGNLLIGLGRFTTPADKYDTRVSRESLSEVFTMARELVPALKERDVITAFAGIRSENSKAVQGDFYVVRSERAPGVIHVVVGSPGLTAAPALAEYVLGLLGEAGWRGEEKRRFQPKRRGWVRFEDRADRADFETLLCRRPDYGRIVCRCERVSEGEICEAIRRGADTLDAVKHLTRAGMGRCQAGFCGIPVLKILARELRIPPTAVTKKGDGSVQIHARR